MDRDIRMLLSVSLESICETACHEWVGKTNSQAVFAVSQSSFLSIPIVFQKNIQFSHQKIPKNKYG